MIIGYDQAGKVWLVMEGGDLRQMPVDLNGIALTARKLTAQQIQAYAALSPTRGGTIFDGTGFQEIAAVAPAPVDPDEIERQVQQVLNSGQGPAIDWQKLVRAKMVSDLAFRLGVAPGALTAAQLLAERNRLAAIYKALP